MKSYKRAKRNINSHAARKREPMQAPLIAQKTGKDSFYPCTHFSIQLRYLEILIHSLAPSTLRSDLKCPMLYIILSIINIVKREFKLMKKLSIGTLLVLLILSQVASGRSPESTLLLGTIQFPQNLKQEIQDVHILYRGDPAPTQIDQTNKNITFSLFRESTQFSFKLLIAEPQSIEQSFLTSKYQTEPTNLVAYQRIKKGKPYRYFMLTFIPEISKDATRHITYTWHIQESRISDKNVRIPDDAIIMHLVPEWVDTLSAGSGFNFPTIQMREDLIQLTGSEERFKKKLSEIALARIDKAPFEGKKQTVAMKQVGNTIIYAAPLIHTTG